MTECPWRETKRRETRDAIVRSAIELTDNAQSIDAISVDDIARHAGISRRTFFNHFPSKMSALLEPLFELRSFYTREVLHAPENTDVWQVLDNAIMATLETCDDLELAARSEFILTHLVHQSSAPAEIPNQEAEIAHAQALHENLRKRLGNDDPVALSLLSVIGEHILRLALRQARSSSSPLTTARDTTRHAFGLLRNTHTNFLPES
ncbi:TetR/AcrR family transcriptional regulator [Arcanobacterium haemolyticum]|uniref:Transcriptional regulator, TetR family n=1 Tax=Arcanobacterium haemolyticum (strain ATCC 9345 / DSM 20595 / CCM 5947 / CCUG 17215 / LMG 16163 / NBRC 15585 / NCTC 8452 / 11018) TaxID=644284 RepID=D7BPA3_ARCHD|nr:TetR/AcrR family transcriptional regulator [Arcanobacterium haemolyticum]ADH92752.1 transcriptional regulator, TetR family [Arcanobacterium haemolyticum DSM 20595]QCX46854.1 TetR/AcrR family transcriptional regulator [Arcanobacterium haemolyticum]SQH28507.1 mycofactocin system transcriptional regulator [Arcanobacterium haemolyticum]